MKYTSRHIDKVIRIIEKKGVPVKTYKNGALTSAAKCYGTEQNIRLGIDDYRYLVLAALVHEWGHCESINLGSPLKQGTVMLYRLGVVLDKKQADAIVEEERRAWRLGFKLLRDNGIQVDKKMLYARRILVETHVKNTKNCLA